MFHLNGISNIKCLNASLNCLFEISATAEKKLILTHSDRLQ